jgi:trimeric autotransporter adhesin
MAANPLGWLDRNFRSFYTDEFTFTIIVLLRFRLRFACKRGGCMRQLVSALWRPQAALIIISFLVLGLSVAGCGKKTAAIPTTISIAPTGSISLAYGDVRELQAQVLDNNGNVMTGQNFVWTSSNTAIASVSGTGIQCGDTTNSSSTSCICGGTWDSRYINCNAPNSAGSATITVSSGGLTATITALVHAGVARVSISPASVNCLSATGTQQLTAHAYDSVGNDITNEVAIDATSFSWTTSDSTVVSINSQGLATAVNPGVARVYAAIAGTSSGPASFTTCPVVSITLSTGSGTSFSIAQAATQQLTATVIDSNNNTITVTSGRLNYNTSYNLAIYVDTTGLATGSNPGGSTIVASCSPPSCNNGLYPVYSNVVNGTIQGASNTGTNNSGGQVLVASPSSTSMYPVALDGTASPTLSDAISLPYYPNSLVYDHANAVAYLGSDTALMQYAYSAPVTCTVTTTNNTCVTPVATAIVAIPGIILNLSNDGTVITLYNDTLKTVTVYSISSAAIIDQFSVPGATLTNIHASTSPDGQTTYVVTGNTLYISNTTTSLQTSTLPTQANDVGFSWQGSFAYLAGGAPSSVTARATCSGAVKDTITVNAIPDRIISSGTGTAMYAIAGSVMNTITPTTTGAGCPPALSDTLAYTDLGLGTISPTQIFTDSFGKYVFMVSSSGKFIIYTTASNSAAAASLSSGTATTADAVLDGSNVWVGGGSDDKIHNITTSSGAETGTVTVPISADLVAVRKE